MGKSSDIRLDPDVVGDSAKRQIPLSDLYALPVFGTDAEQKAMERRIEEKQILGHIRQGIFAADGWKREKKMKEIYGQIFQVSEELVIPKDSVRSEAAREAGNFPEIAAIGGMVLLLGMWAACRKKARRLG